MRKIAYLILTTVSIYLCIMYDGAASFYLLGFLILLALVLYGSSWYLRAHLRVHLNVQIPVVEKGQEFPVEIWVENTGILPMPKIRLTLLHDSDYVGKPEKKRLILGIGPKKKERQKEKFTMKYAGRYYFYVTEARVYDVIRLFSKKVSVRDDNVFVNVLPTIREIPVEVDPRTRQHMPDSDEYATDRKGEDVSEIYAIREYRPGDSMKTIHWKLSARMDHWMVKEFSFPQGVQVLLLLDLYTASSKNFREEEMDALLGNFSSLSYSLAGKGVSHVAAWYDDAMGELQRCRIDDEEGTYAMVDQLLAAVPYGWKYDIENGYDKEYPGEIFAASLILDTEGKLRNNGTVIAEFSTEGQEQQVIV